MILTNIRLSLYIYMIGTLLFRLYPIILFESKH